MGLALGICGCLVIYLVVNYEFSFDTFHPDKTGFIALILI